MTSSQPRLSPRRKFLWENSLLVVVVFVVGSECTQRKRRPPSIFQPDRGEGGGKKGEEMQWKKTLSLRLCARAFVFAVGKSKQSKAAATCCVVPLALKEAFFTTRMQSSISPSSPLLLLNCWPEAVREREQQQCLVSVKLYYAHKHTCHQPHLSGISVWKFPPCLDQDTRLLRTDVGFIAF